MIRVSVIVPVYNRQATIGKAISSVLAQRFPAFEIIVVDDGSTDATSSVVASIQDARIVHLRQDNAGAGAARNRGLDHARGDWIAFLDSDDWWCETRLSAAVAAIEARPTLQFMQSNRLHVHENASRNHAHSASRARMEDADSLLSAFIIKTSAVMIRRDLILHHRLRFPVDQKTCEDYHLFWRAILFAEAIGYTEALDVMIRALPESLSRRNSDAYLQRDNIKTLVEVRDWALRNGAKPGHVRALSEHLHWQLRDYFVMLMRDRQLTTLVRYAALAAKHEGPVRGMRGLLSALVGLGSGTPVAPVER